MIADLHCHYPMHLLPKDDHPRGKAGGWLRHLKDEFDARAVAITAHLANDPTLWEGWRVDLNSLVDGQAQIVCSVLFWPASEFRLGSTPAPGAFEDLKNLLGFVERELDRLDSAGALHIVVRDASHLNGGNRVAFVHCVEGGFHLGADEATIDANVQWLAEHGVLYITLAHLFFKGVATNAPAIPLLSDHEYAAIFHQPAVGLTALGTAAVRSMYRHKVLVDISHMSEQAIDDTFALIEELDRGPGGDSSAFPVLATHVGMRSVGPDTQLYNLTADTARRIHDRGGLIGLIMAQHQLGSTAREDESRATLRRHIEAIRAACGGLESCAIGTDLDGFIKPTVAGLERASDFTKLANWIRADFDGDADTILYGNARRVLQSVFAARARPAGPPVGAPAAALSTSAALDGFYHPSSESELVELVQMAAGEKKQLRVRGAAHSVSHAIYADPLSDIENTVSWQKPPDGDGIEVMLDQYRGCQVIDETNKLLEAEAGIHLGEDPSDPTGTSSIENSLLHVLSQKGWMLSNLGGITHQTVSGFTATGSAGGSVQHSVNDNLWAFRVIDGQGKVQQFSRADPDPSLFHAMSPNLGLHGVVSKLVFKCEDTYNINGQAAITTIDDCAIDLFGPGSAAKPSLERFLRDTEYARVEWWPQPGAECVQVWQAQRIAAAAGFHPVPYRAFTAHPEVAEVAMSILLTVFGNLDDLSRAQPQLEKAFERVRDFLDLLPGLKRLGWLGGVLAKFLSRGAEHGADGALELLRPLAPLVKREIPEIFPRLLGIFIPLDADKPRGEKGQPQRFHDYAWHGLPMDNEADDVLFRTAFTEIWLPLPRTRDAMQVLRDYFYGPTDAHESYRRTGLNGWELYAAKPTELWMSPSHQVPAEDGWDQGAFRIDPYWFAPNGSDPMDFYGPIWKLFYDSGIPFRLHWGKYQPPPGAVDWVSFFRSHYPRWDEFTALRAARDPSGTFLTSYWRERFGI